MKVRRVREYNVVVKGYWFELAWDHVMTTHGLKFVDDVTFDNQEAAVGWAKELLVKYLDVCRDQLEWRPASYAREDEKLAVEGDLNAGANEVTYEARPCSDSANFDIVDRHNSTISVRVQREVEWRAFANSPETVIRIIDGEEWTRREPRTRFTPWRKSYLHDTTTVTVVARDRVIVG